VHGCRWRRRCRWGRVGRPPKPVLVYHVPPVDKLVPVPQLGGEPVYLDLAEVEALRMVELEKLTLEEAGARMGVSRTTVWRLVESGREKLVRALVEGRPVVIVKE